MQLYRPGNVVAERYELKEVLGQGPVGATYLAFDKEIEAEVALKILASELLSSEVISAFDAMFEKLSNFSHPNLRKLYEYEAQAQNSLVLYTGVYHQGESLRQMLQSRKVFSHLEAEPILSQICQALTAAEKHTAHGALRPENILVLPETVKVTDLGLAAALGSTYTATVRKGGVSRYLAPEVKAGGPISTRADVYSLGVLFYEMLAGEPYDGSTVSFSAKNASLPPSLDDVAKIALAANPADRYANANEFAEDLASVIDTGKIKPRASMPSNTTTPAIAAAVVAEPAPQETAPTEAKPEEPPTFAVSDDAIELSVIAASNAPEISRIDNVLPPTQIGDNDRTVLRSAASIAAMKPFGADPSADPAGLRGAPTRSPSASKDPADDLFGGASLDLQKTKPPERRTPPVPSATPPPIAPPALNNNAQNSAAYSNQTAPSTALARAADLPPPVMAPPSQGAVVMPGWALGMFGFLLLGLFGVVIYLLIRPPQPQQPIYAPVPVQDNPLVNKTPNPVSEPVLVPPPKSLAASTQATPATSLATSNAASTPASLASTNPVVDPKLVGVDPKNPVDPKDPKLVGVDPKNPKITPDPKDPKLVGTPPEIVKALACPGGMTKLTVGKEKREYCIDRYEYPNAKGATPQTGVDFGTAEATCKAKGKRLCSSEEWGRGCGGAYPYGKDFDATACNTKDAEDNARSVAAAGSFPKCKAGGVYDMSGNVEEWVEGGSKRGGSAKSGDTFATCSKSTKGGASEFTGFRCCADPK